MADINRKVLILIVAIVIIFVVIIGILLLNKSKSNDSIIADNSETNSSLLVDNETNNSTDLMTYQEETIIESDKKDMIDKIYVEINGRKLTATLEENNSSQEFVEKLKEKSITIDMHDYANMEKVGDLGFSMTRSDKQISVSSGDIILYQGNQITIYYGTNSWTFTRLGHIDDISSSELKSLLGNGNVSVTFSI